MSTSELQESIIQKVLHTNDTQLLDFLNDILSHSEKRETYQFYDFERRILSESKIDYASGNTIPDKDVFNRNEKWLEE